MNDIFFFVKGNKLTNYADDNTPYTINEDIGDLTKNLENDSSKLIKWFSDGEITFISY